VYNLKHCIKVACDFVCPENVRRCLSLMQEFRKLPMGHHRKEGIVQIKAMMFFSWKGLMDQGVEERSVEVENQG
jgi:lysine-specific demethylase 3